MHVSFWSVSSSMDSPKWTQGSLWRRGNRIEKVCWFFKVFSFSSAGSCPICVESLAFNSPYIKWSSCQRKYDSLYVLFFCKLLLHIMKCRILQFINYIEHLAHGRLWHMEPFRKCMVSNGSSPWQARAANNKSRWRLAQQNQSWIWSPASQFEYFLRLDSKISSFSPGNSRI